MSHILTSRLQLRHQLESARWIKYEDVPVAPGGMPPGLTPPPTLTATPSSITTSAAISPPGVTLATLAVSGGTGIYTFSLSSNPGGRYTIVGNQLEVASPLVVGTDTVIVQATSSAGGIVAIDVPVTVIPSTGVGACDPYWANTVLLAHFDGLNGSTGAPGFTDKSSYAHGTATGANAGAAITTAQSQFGGSSLGLNGGSSIAWPDSNDFNLGGGMFTVECWLRPTSSAGQQFIVGQWQNTGNLGWVISWSLAAGRLDFNVSTTGSDNLQQLLGNGITLNAWQHIAIDYDNAKYRMYINGVMVASNAARRVIFDSPNHLTVGSNDANNSFWLSGQVDELRITKGVARYATDTSFTVPTAAFPEIVCGAPGDLYWSNVVLLLPFEGANLLTGAGVTRNGTLTPSGGFSGTFTENNLSGDHQVYFATTTAVTNTLQNVSVTLERGTGTHNRFVRLQVVDNPAAILKGFHVDLDMATGSVNSPAGYGDGSVQAVTAQLIGSSLTVNMTGICSASTSITPFVSIAPCTSLGIFNYAGTNDQCFIFNQAALVMATGAPAMADQSSHAHGTATPSFEVSVTASRSKFDAASLWLTRAGATGKSQITFPTSSDWDLGNGPFTLEMFVYPIQLDGVSSTQPLLRGPNDNWMLYFQGAQLSFRYTDGVTPIAISDTVGVTAPYGWYYVCIDFDGTKYRLYTNVNRSDQTANSSTLMVASSTTLETIASSATVLSIGDTGTVISRHVPEVYLDEIRLTKGVARYATDSGYVVPTLPFPTH